MDYSPLHAPPTPSFTRTNSVAVTFGYLSPSDAAHALTLPPAFPAEPERQRRYTAFLESQLGKTRDHYDAFLKSVKQFGDENLGFVEIAKGLGADLIESAKSAPAPVAPVAPVVASEDRMEVEEMDEKVELVEPRGLLGRLKWAVGFGN